MKRIDYLSLALVLIGILWGIKQRSGLPAVPLLNPDSWGYLKPALSWLSGAGFQETYGRNWLYSALLASVVRLSGNFRSIVSLQHFLGLLGAPLLWLTVRVWLSIFPKRSDLCHGVAVILAAMAAFAYVLSTTQIQFELTVGPEGVLAFFLLLTLIAVLVYFRARWLSCQTWPAVVSGGASLCLCYLVMQLKPSWTLSLVPVSTLLLAGTVGRTQRALRFVPASAAIFLAGAMMILPQLLGFKHDLGARTLLPFNLVGIHAAQIVQNAERHHLIGANGPQSQEIEARFYYELKQAWNESRTVPTKNRTLGFDPNYIMYTKDLLWAFRAENKLSDTAVINLCYTAYWRTWRESPGLMAAKILKQIGLFLTAPSKDLSAYALGRERLLGIAGQPNSPAQAFLAEAESAEYANQPACISYRRELEKVLEQDWRIKHVAIQRYLAILFAKSAGWIQILFFAAMFPILFYRRFCDLRLPVWSAATVAAILYGNVLTTAIAHTLDVDRYRTSYMPALLVTLV
ncbi:MAG: hypothetical protein JO271_16720, partial [Verrucomicrobia bacterium]|nr:hypothetical protein [Verrucomicrobiota bacterium]